MEGGRTISHHRVEVVSEDWRHSGDHGWICHNCLRMSKGRRAIDPLCAILAVCWTAFVLAGTLVGNSYLPNRETRNWIEAAAMAAPVWLLWALVFRVIWKADKNS